MEASAAFAASDVVERIQAALGDHGSGRVLDLACGPGLLASALASRARSLVGVDLTPAMLDRARERLAGAANVEVRLGEAESIPADDDAFDAVVTRLSVHHFREPARVLAEVRRVLAPGGALVLADVVASEHEPDAVVHNALEQLRDPSHVRMLPGSELRLVVRQAGFDVVSESSWRVDRRFDEWAAIVDDESRTAPLREVMTHLAQAGHRLGIELREEDGAPCFVHSWLLLTALPVRP